jgi:transaldolase
MLFFLDTANLDDIAHFQSMGMVDGVTTNPSIIAQSGLDFLTHIKTIAHMVDGSVSAEVISTNFDGMMKEAEVLGALAPNITIKVPLTTDGLKACYALTQKGMSVNVTLCFSAAQALMAAKAGATYISPFIGRLDDIGHDGLDLIADIRDIYDTHEGLDTKILAASIRTPNHLLEAARLGADVATIPPKLLHTLHKHPLTDKGLDAFLADWKKSGQQI